MTYILVLFIYAGALAQGDSVTLLEVPGFKTEAECIEAGKKTDRLTSGTTKNVKFVCLSQTK